MEKLKKLIAVRLTIRQSVTKACNKILTTLQKSTSAYRFRTPKSRRKPTGGGAAVSAIASGEASSAKDLEANGGIGYDSNITTVVPNDTYRLVQWTDNRRYTVTAHCSQVRLFKLAEEDGGDYSDEEADEPTTDWAAQPQADGPPAPAATEDAGGRNNTATKPSKDGGQLRQSTRIRRRPTRWGDYVVS